MFPFFNWMSSYWHTLEGGKVVMMGFIIYLCFGFVGFFILLRFNLFCYAIAILKTIFVVVLILSLIEWWEWNAKTNFDYRCWTNKFWKFSISICLHSKMIFVSTFVIFMYDWLFVYISVNESKKEIVYTEDTKLIILQCKRN